MPEIDLRGASDERIVDGALRCIARWGLAKTTVEDVAREAGCSRATLYRAFPGGKDAILAAVAAAELTDDDIAIARVIGDVWLSALVGWVTGRTSAADTAAQMEKAVHLLLRD